MKTLKQRYASVAFTFVEEVKNTNKQKLQKDYLSRVKKLPSMITHNGLLTTLTFLFAKSKGNLENNADGVILKQLVCFLTNYPNQVENIKSCDNVNVCQFIRDLAKTDFKRLILHTKRALELSQWLKRLAEGTFKEETSNEG